MYIEELKRIATWVGNSSDALNETITKIDRVPEDVERRGNLDLAVTSDFDHYEIVNEALEDVLAEVRELRKYADQLDLQVAKRLLIMSANIQREMNRYANAD